MQKAQLELVVPFVLHIVSCNMYKDTAANCATFVAECIYTD